MEKPWITQGQLHHQKSLQGNTQAGIRLKAPIDSREDWNMEENPLAAYRQPRHLRVPPRSSLPLIQLWVPQHGVPRHALLMCSLGELDRNGACPWTDLPPAYSSPWRPHTKEKRLLNMEGYFKRQVCSHLKTSGPRPCHAQAN